MEAEKRKPIDFGGQVSKKQRSQCNPEQVSLPVKPGLDMLPVELLNKILAHLSTSDLLCNVARLNKKFHEIAHSPHVHLVVTLKVGADEEQGSKFLETATQMREVNITHDQTSGGKCDKKILALVNHYRLRFVKISTSAKITAVTFITLSKSVWWKNLQKFEFYFRHGAKSKLYKNKWFAAAVESLGSGGNLTELAFGYGFSDVFPEPLLNLLSGPTLNKLKKLTLHNACLDPSVLDKITEARKDSLEDLAFEGNGNELKTFRRPLKCSNLKILTIPTRFDGFEHLPSLTKLTTLNLGWINADHKVENVLPANSMPEMLNISLYTLYFQNLDHSRRLPLDSDYDEEDHENCFDDGHVDETGLGLPVTALAQACPNLRVLKYDSGDTTLTLDTFKVVIGSCTKLEVLIWTIDDTGDPIVEIDIDEVVPQICENLTNLKILDLHEWNFTEDNERMFLQKCRNLLALCHDRFILDENGFRDDYKRHLSLKTGVTLEHLEECYDYIPKFETQESF